MSSDYEFFFSGLQDFVKDKGKGVARRSSRVCHSCTMCASPSRVPRGENEEGDDSGVGKEDVRSSYVGFPFKFPQKITRGLTLIVTVHLRSTDNRG
jgi:hypothetical protein